MTVAPAQPKLWLVRAGSYLLVIASLIWISTIFPEIPDSGLTTVAARIRRGENFSPAVLRQFVQTNDLKQRQVCNFKAQRDIVLLQLSLADAALQGVDFKAADLEIDNVQNAAKTLLACAPNEGIGWLGLYWAQIRQKGFGPDAVALLEQSYRFAPHEAWIQLLRAPVALRALSFLPPPLQAKVLTDFKDIIGADLFASAAAIVHSTNARDRNRLLDQLCDYPDEKRAVFVNFLQGENLYLKHRCLPQDDKPAYMR